ncbi:orotidine-5'-phosphate decarboxylase [Segnochrobactrum spirostomi]|uniref:Orotidine 5'-phosphate decarboxylase n=1 Tax=Segnochrobactrum spirostomi TaxID=2608987 RepID=A0A6A7Y5I9_9HYPH|nr:orotidine-5'-phosphate decarboxylase [Segnochrobactrum spirostomi]MQT12919.1 orotidine-5'-phosphate decarboxylase [Segnochrobactrum spirostomi]
MTARFRPQTPRDRLVLAVDTADVAAARAVVDETAGTIGVYKIGLELIYAGGLDLVRDLVAGGERVFLDAKLLDIDNTVAGAIRSIVTLGVDMVTLHAYPKAMAAAAAARGAAPLALLGVTVLTSMDEADFADAGYRGTVEERVRARAAQAAAAGLDGIVCSPREIAAVRAAAGPDLLIVTPGVRPAGSAAGDQKRIATPAEAIRAGADLLVVGRPIVGAPDRREAARRIVDEIAGALG